MTGSLPVIPQMEWNRETEMSFLDSRRETPTAMTFRFSREGTSFTFRPNQAVRVILPGVEDPWGPRRSFSLSSSPTEKEFIAVTTKITDTPYKQALARLRSGDRAIIVGPRGDFFYEPSRPALFLAGGIGVAPFRGMLKFASDTHGTQPIRLLYSARTPEEFAFREELDRLTGPATPFEVHYTVTRTHESPTRWAGRVGRIDEGWVREHAEGLDHPKFYVVGLPEMATPVLEMLRSRLGVVEDDLEYEFFKGY